MSNSDRSNNYWVWYQNNGYTPLINVTGTMTGLGGSVSGIKVREATSAAMAHFVNIHEMQRQASKTISELTGAEAGCITASASAGITMAIAGCMSGLDAARAEALPRQTGERNEVVIQLGHMCTYGAPISTAIELAGAQVRAIGQSTQVADYQLEGALNENTAAALYVVSHHVVHYGQIPFERFAEIAHAKHVPVIVDAASEYDLHRFIKEGADCVIYSGHKFLGGPTSGIVAGKRELIQATYLQNVGIGRGMKIGKESIAGCIAAMGEWMKRDHVAIRRQESDALDLWVKALTGLAGVEARIVSDPTGNPLQRLQVNIDQGKAGASAASFARVLGEQDPAIIVRNHEVELGYFQLDPCNLIQGQAELVAKTLVRVLGDGQNIIALKDDLAQARNAGIQGYMKWLNDLD